MQPQHVRYKGNRTALVRAFLIAAAALSIGVALMTPNDWGTVLRLIAG